MELLPEQRTQMLALKHSWQHKVDRARAHAVDLAEQPIGYHAIYPVSRPG